MLRRHGSYIVAALLVALVATACIVRTRTARRGQPVYIEQHGHKHKHKHKHVKAPKPAKHKHKKLHN